jgi:hypothetical protein
MKDYVRVCAMSILAKVSELLHYPITIQRLIIFKSRISQIYFLSLLSNSTSSGCTNLPLLAINISS